MFAQISYYYCTKYQKGHFLSSVGHSVQIIQLFQVQTEFGRSLLQIETVIPASFGTFDLLVLPVQYAGNKKMKIARSFGKQPLRN